MVGRNISLLAIAVALVPTHRVEAEDGVFLLHVAPASFSACESFEDATASCRDIVTSTDGSSDSFVWLLASDPGGEIGGAQFGITYESSVSVATWTLCTGGSQIPDDGWPGPGAGNAVTWADGCTRTGGADMAKIGFFYVPGGSAGTMQVIADPRVDQALFADCDEVDVVSYEVCNVHGKVAIGGGSGYVPQNCLCAGPLIEERTWATIKSTYRD